MDVDSLVVNPVLDQGTNRPFQAFPNHPRLFNIGPTSENGQFQSNRILKRTHVNGLTTSLIEENLRNEMSLEWRKQRLDTISGAESPLVAGSALKDFLNQGMLPYQSQSLTHYQSHDTYPSSGAYSFHESQTRMGLEVSPGFYNSNSISHPIASPAGSSMLCDSNYFQQSRSNDQEASSLLPASSGKGMPSVVEGKQIFGEVVSPEQISSVTACSDADWYSDKETFEDGTTFAVTPFSDPELGGSNWTGNGLSMDNNMSFAHVGSKSLLGDFMELDKCITLLPGQPRVPEYSKYLSSGIFSKPNLIRDGLSQCQIQMLQSIQSHQQGFHSRSHFDIPGEAQQHPCSVGQNFYSEVAGERLLTLSQPSEKLCGFLQSQFFNLQDLEPGKVRKILFLYIKFKNKLLDACINHQEFLNALHMAVCSAKKCECEASISLVSHFDTCYSAECGICGHLRQCSPVEKINFGENLETFSMRKTAPGSGNQDGDCFEGLHHKISNIEDMQVITKRRKVENTVPPDNWSLGAIALSCTQPGETKHAYSVQQFGGPINDEQTSVRMNQVPLKSEEPPQAHISRNYAADSGGSTCTHPCSKENEEKLHSGQSSDGHRSRATLNKKMNSSLVNLAKSDLTANDAFSDDKSLENDDTSFTSALLNLMDKQKQHIISSEVKHDGMPAFLEKGEDQTIKLASEADSGRRNGNSDSNRCQSDYQSGQNTEALKGLGVSLTDFFTPEQIKEHLRSLSNGVELIAEKDVTGDSNMHSVGENTCQLCSVDRLMFTAPPMYCTACGARIKRGLTYYWTTDELGVHCCFCTLCFKESRGGSISFRGLSFPKAKLYKGKNTEESEEAWVQCDKCEHWQHQICGLYNSNQDVEGKGNYICPICRLLEIESKEHVPHPPAFGANDLPRTILSDHIEQRLSRSLDQERKERAKLLGKSPEEVPGAADLVVRVVLSVNKQLKVKEQFLDILHGENYPSEFPYRSKVILLFQKVEGVDVCLFAMYVQEYGSDCGQPNQRSVYISYLDSVKYFRPEIKTVSGVAMRTFVYHEILRGYLDYCKQRGFTTCYIWACPPLRGEDYILYCHPENQKTPKSDKLCHWYKMMLRTAQEENIVLEHTNFYDYFFVPRGACNKKITAARLPYFDGDYWSGAIEDMLRAIEKDSGGESERKMKKHMSKRTLKAMGHSDLSVDATKDILVMQTLGHSILPVKQDFIIAHLQFTCINCHEPIVSGSRWSCDLCSNFHLCNRCLEVKPPNRLETHTNIRGEEHVLRQIPVDEVPADTEDNDVILDNDVFENRHSFLNFCQNYHYQFDTLRRAKHSSMMILYHLHKTTALSSGTLCSICRQDTMMGWHCEICSKFYVCNACYQKDGDGCHVHKLEQRSMKTEPRTKIEKMQHQRALELREVLDLLLHANQCRASKCSYPKCPKLKIIFLHSRGCKLRARGGCFECRKIWHLMTLHARYCRDSNCIFPRCDELKNRDEMLKAQSERLRRAAITGKLLY